MTLCKCHSPGPWGDVLLAGKAMIRRPLKERDIYPCVRSAEHCSSVRGRVTRSWARAIDSSKTGAGGQPLPFLKLRGRNYALTNCVNYHKL